MKTVAGVANMPPMSDQNPTPPTFLEWILSLPWWAKLMIFGGTGAGVYYSLPFGH